MVAQLEASPVAAAEVASVVDTKEAVSPTTKSLEPAQTTTETPILLQMRQKRLLPQKLEVAIVEAAEAASAANIVATSEVAEAEAVSVAATPMNTEEERAVKTPSIETKATPRIPRVERVKKRDLKESSLSLTTRKVATTTKEGSTTEATRSALRATPPKI